MKKLALLMAMVLAGCATQPATDKPAPTQENSSTTSEPDAIAKALAESRKTREKIATEGDICPDLVGTWYTDTVTRPQQGPKRDIALIKRKADGTVDLKLVSVYFSKNTIVDKELQNTWSCDGEWYTETNEWGSVDFRIVTVSEEKNILFDEHNHFKSFKPVNIYEKTSLPDPQVTDRVLRSRKVREFLEMPPLPEHLLVK